MSHYQKLATVLLRVAGFLGFVLGGAGVLYNLVAHSANPTVEAERGYRFWGSVIYVIIGVTVFVLSPRLGRWVGSGLAAPDRDAAA
jgi:hypothetical protein